MKIFHCILLLICFAIPVSAQNLEVVGTVKITEMAKDNTADSVVVRLSDGTLGIREAHTLSGVSYLGKDTLDGIVFYIYKGADGEDHGLIVSKTESESDRQWQSSTSLINADRSWDGNYNTGLMISSPAKTYVEGLGPGWYLPSIDELGLLWQNRFHVNRGLFNGGFTLLSKDDIYWSSTEISATSAFGFDFSEIRSDPGDKTETHAVRAIRSF